MKWSELFTSSNSSTSVPASKDDEPAWEVVRRGRARNPNFVHRTRAPGVPRTNPFRRRSDHTQTSKGQEVSGRSGSMRRLRTRRARTSVSEGVNNTQHADSAERCSVLNQTRGGEGRIGRMRREISVLPPAPAIAPATGIEQPPPIAVAPAPAPIPAPVAAPASEQARR